MAASEDASERSALLSQVASDRQVKTAEDAAQKRRRRPQLSRDDRELGETTVGEILPYNDYATIDWMHDLAKDAVRARGIRSRPGFRNRLLAHLDAAEGWIAAAVSGLLTAIVAFGVDVAEATVSDTKFGYCTTHLLSTRKSCCTDKVPGANSFAYDASLEPTCDAWRAWGSSYWAAFGIYVGFALLFALLSVNLTLLTKSQMPSSARQLGDDDPSPKHVKSGKTIYLAAGSGIPEIKTILSGFVIPDILGLKVLVVKAVGAVFAVGSGVCNESRSRCPKLTAEALLGKGGSICAYIHLCCLPCRDTSTQVS